MPSPREMAPVYGEARLSVFHDRNVQVAVWRDAPSLERMHAVWEATQALHDRYPERTGFLNLIAHGRPSFSPEVRQETAAQSKRGLHRRGVAHVILVPGLLGASVRAFLSTAILLGRPVNPTRVFSSVEEASAWLSAQLVGTVEPPWNGPMLSSLAQGCLDAAEELASATAP